MGDISRRDFLKLSAGGAAGIVNIGNKTINRLIPYVTTPEHLEPGEWTVYNTTCRECPAGCGMYLRHREGRIIKAEGNPNHPINRGGLCPRGQSSLQGQYDPDRIQTPLIYKDNKHSPIEWKVVLDQVAKLLHNSQGKVAFLCDLQTGTLSLVMKDFIKAFDSDRLLFYEPFNYEALRWSYGMLFGRPEIPYYHLDQCEMILSFGADFLENWISNVEFSWQFVTTHSRVEKAGQFVYIGPRLSMTAANADELILMSPESMRCLAWAMLGIIIKNGWAKKILMVFVLF
jgi:molybdopterin-containing oxidoreductase family iron-sulfur binding subunit